MSAMFALARVAHDWAVRCFGEDHVSNLPLRSLRILEEAAELAQSLGVPREKAHQVVHVVYGRPRGQPSQELSGLLFTVAVMCAERGADPEQYLLGELRRVLSKPPAEFAQRNQDKIDLGLG